ncbi:hypothetical protein PSCICF_37700 [Pseudomonas cichorii]|nr:hypothetical protein PSCICF_37700 [Pseudomonas cichorii]GFM62796.1 hypothetical protein PSCICG_39560 [Pseudomonas cichorii]
MARHTGEAGLLGHGDEKGHFLNAIHIFPDVGGRGGLSASLSRSLGQHCNNRKSELTGVVILGTSRNA